MGTRRVNVIELLILAIFAFLLIGCGETEEPTGSCVPNETQSCLCSGDQTGVQTCLPEGFFASCECEPGEEQNQENNSNNNHGSQNQTQSSNACGGSSVLRYEGLDSAPGDACGECADGVLICNGPNALRCIYDSAPNVCGGCQNLAGEPEDSCGPCESGRLACNAEGYLSCEDAAAPNPCGGCTSLANTPFFTCQEEGLTGVFQCRSSEEAVCVLPGQNPCGGTETLEGLPTESCGVCNQGTWVCDGQDSVICEDEDRGLNPCGGCSLLPHSPGSSCGDCGGMWQCEGADHVVCSEPINPCGGCAPLSAEPGSLCGEGGQFVCDGDESLRCDEEITSNLCGGQSSLSSSPGESCGPCLDGSVICVTPDMTACLGGRPQNACGGCQSLPGIPDAPCASGGVWECDGEEALLCSYSTDDQNLCGGESELDEIPGTNCNDCGLWVCSGGEAVVCVGSTDTDTDANNCGACGVQCSDLEYCSEGTCQFDEVVDVAMGWNHGCVLRASGAVYCWGGGANGQLGTGFTTDLRQPTRVLNIDDAVSIAAGASNTCAVLSSGQARCWGTQNNGVLGNGQTTGQSAIPVTVSNLDDVSALSINNSHSCAISGGDAYCWGSNGVGQLGTGDTTLRSTPTLVDFQFPGPVTEISTGHIHTCAISNGQGYCWGFNRDRQLGDGSDTNRSTPTAVLGVQGTLERISAGREHTCAVTTQGVVWCWGRGSVVTGSSNPDGSAPVVVAGLQGAAIDVRAGDQRTCVLLASGEVQCWGTNPVGNGSSAFYSTPQLVTGLTDAERIDMTRNSTCALKESGQVACWGSNSRGALGDNQLPTSNPTPRATPTIIPTLPPITSEAGLCFTGEDNSGNGLVDCDDPDCATDLGSVLGNEVAQGSLYGEGNYRVGTCGGVGGERVYRWTAPYNGSFTVDGLGSSNWIVFYVLSGSCLGVELACDSSSGSLNQPRLTFEAVGGETYFIVVDSLSQNTASTDYMVSIQPGN